MTAPLVPPGPAGPGPASFDVVRAAAPVPVIVDVPHAGLVIDDLASSFMRIPERAIRAGAIEADADLGADLVWEGTERAGVTRVVARTSRHVIDLNTDPHPPPRAPFYEVDPEPSRIFRRSQCGASWVEAAMPRAEWQRRVTGILEPYHRAIEAELERARALHGVACLVSAHTFHDRKRAIADVVLGTQHERAAPAALREAVADVARSAGLTVALEDPFRGGWCLTRHARPSEGVVGIQIEIARRLVTSGDGTSSAVDPGALAKLQELARAIIPALVTALRTTRAPP